MFEYAAPALAEGNFKWAGVPDRRNLFMCKILVIEDDKEINRLICEYLTESGYELMSAANGIAGLSLLESTPDIDLCLLDLMLPMKSGDRVMQSLREFSDVPVIVLSAKDMVQTKIDLFRLGVDDYITKPFDLDELLVRVEAVLNRCIYRKSSGHPCGIKGIAGYFSNDKKSAASMDISGRLNPERGNTNVGVALGNEVETKNTKVLHQGYTYIYKHLIMDDEAKIVTVDGNKLDITAKEYGILRLLLTNPNKLFSKANLFESVWDETYYPEDNVLKVHMSNLRNKIKKYDDQEYIETVWGMGYKLAE